MENKQTTFSDKCAILAELWSDYKDEDQFQDFFEYADLGLPLAFCHHQEIIFIEEGDNAQEVVEEAFDVLIFGLGFKFDEGWDNLSDVLNQAIDRQDKE